jgi:hypothetical protein
MTPTAFASHPLDTLTQLLREAPALAARLQPLPVWGLALVGAAGLAVLLAGARWRRPVALFGGAGVGWLAGLAGAGVLGLPGGLFPLLGAIVLGGASLLLPPIFPFAVGGLVGAFLGGHLPVPGQGPVAGAVSLFLLGGLGLLAARLLAAAAAGLAGAAVLGLALLAGARHWQPLAALAARPVVLAGLLLVVAIAGAAYQAGTAWGGAGGGGARKKANPPREAGAAA